METSQLSMVEQQQNLQLNLGIAMFRQGTETLGKTLLSLEPVTTETSIFGSNTLTLDQEDKT